MKTVWQKMDRGHSTRIHDFRVERSRLNSGKHLYWVFWFENVDWAAPHSKMSGAMNSLKQAKAFIERLKQRDGAKARLKQRLTLVWSA
jgi:hypothetical protein